MPTQEDISNVRKNCQALLKAMEAQRRLESALEAWTEGLMPAINILGNNGINDESFLTTYHDFMAVQHLFFVPQVLNEIEPYYRMKVSRVMNQYNLPLAITLPSPSPPPQIHPLSLLNYL